MLNPAEIKRPGVYIDEVPKFPPSVAEVATAIPAFIGYVERLTYNGQSLQNRPTRIRSLAEFTEVYGGAFPVVHGAAQMNITIGPDGKIAGVLPDLNPLLRFKMYQSLQMFFANGGGACYIVAVNNYFNGANPRAVSDSELIAGLSSLSKEDEPTLLVFPDATSLADTDPGKAAYHSILKSALTQCANLKDRFLVADVKSGTSPASTNIADFRDGIGVNNLSYGAAYYPWLKTIIGFEPDEANILVSGVVYRPQEGYVSAPQNNVPLNRLVQPAAGSTLIINGGTPAANKTFTEVTNSALYRYIKEELAKQKVLLPPSSAVAGVYASIDNTRGVWKAPANYSLNYVVEPAFKIDDDIQGDLNVHSTGKSVNAIRTFEGKGSLVWGARTLAGNDNEWRYVPVRRFFNFAEESIKKATEPFVFEPNDANTWVKVKTMIENFLLNQWRAGALAGAKPEHAFYVKCALGETMTSLDILEGRMIVEIGMAVVRPAEFIILRFAHKMQES